jgi:hypothetical protein
VKEVSTTFPVYNFEKTKKKATLTLRETKALQLSINQSKKSKFFAFSSSQNH